MSSKVLRYGATVSVAVIIGLMLVLSWITVDEDFPAFQYAQPGVRDQLVEAEPYNGIAEGVARFLWDHRALDLNSQAFVIVAAIMCSLAMLKAEEGEH
ncbi:MAG TPA: hypothetical protein VGB32_09495 [Candidatus Bathyarchaeia archaeon]